MAENDEVRDDEMSYEEWAQLNGIKVDAPYEGLDFLERGGCVLEG